MSINISSKSLHSWSMIEWINVNYADGYETLLFDLTENQETQGNVMSAIEAGCENKPVVVKLKMDNNGFNSAKELLEKFELLASVASYEGFRMIAIRRRNSNSEVNSYSTDSIFYDLTNSSLQADDLNFCSRFLTEKGVAVLELGCGTCRLAAQFLENENTYFGIDTSSDMLRFGLLKYFFEPRVTLALGSMLNICDIGRYDFLLCGFNTLQHCSNSGDIEQFLVNSRCLLKPEGKLIIDIFNPDFRFLSEDEQTDFKVEFYSEIIKSKIRLYETHFYNPKTRINHIIYNYYEVDGDKNWTGKYDMLQIFPDDIDTAIMNNNTYNLEKFGDYKYLPFTSESPKQIIVLTAIGDDKAGKPYKLWRESGYLLEAVKYDWYRTLMELENCISFISHKYFFQKGLSTLFLPVTTTSISSPMGLGSDSLPVSVKMFGKNIYLADSMQFMLEYACRFHAKGAYYIMNSFRGEDVDERHLSQFFHCEAEIIGNMDNVISLVEDYLRVLCREMLESCADGIKKFAGDTKHIEKFIATPKFPEITFDQAAELLTNNENYITPHEDGYRTITTAGEQALIAHYGGPVWIKNFDYLSVPFYQTHSADYRYAVNADLLMGIGETVGAGQRHIGGKELRDALEFHKVNPAEYKWYCDMKDNYPMQTAGFGMGIERFLLFLLKHNDIRDCQMLPRFKSGINIG